MNFVLYLFFFCFLFFHFYHYLYWHFHYNQPTDIFSKAVWLVESGYNGLSLIFLESLYNKVACFSSFIASIWYQSSCIVSYALVFEYFLSNGVARHYWISIKNLLSVIKLILSIAMLSTFIMIWVAWIFLMMIFFLSKDVIILIRHNVMTLMSQYVIILERAMKMISSWNKVFHKTNSLENFCSFALTVFGKVLKTFYIKGFYNNVKLLDKSEI